MKITQIKTCIKRCPYCPAVFGFAWEIVPDVYNSSTVNAYSEHYRTYVDHLKQHRIDSQAAFEHFVKQAKELR